MFKKRKNKEIVIIPTDAKIPKGTRSRLVLEYDIDGAINWLECLHSDGTPCLTEDRNRAGTFLMREVRHLFPDDRITMHTHWLEKGNLVPLRDPAKVRLEMALGVAEATRTQIPEMTDILCRDAKVLQRHIRRKSKSFWTKKDQKAYDIADRILKKVAKHSNKLWCWYWIRQLTRALKLIGADRGSA